MSRTSARVKSRSVFCVILNITDAIVINAQDFAGRIPLCVPAKCLTLLRGDHLCDTCCAQFRSTPEYGQTARVIPWLMSFTAIDLRRFFFGTRLALLRGSGTSWITTSTGQGRLCAWIQETRSVTSDLRCDGSRSSVCCARAVKCL